MSTELSSNSKGPVYGDTISKADADVMFRKAHDIEVANEGILKNAIGADPEADSYYTAPTFGYIFSKSCVQLLLDKMTTDDHYLVLFRGSKETSSGSTNQGRKTLIGMVYMADTATTLQLDTTSAASATRIGVEHPGIVKAVSDYNMIPFTIDTSVIQP